VYRRLGFVIEGWYRIFAGEPVLGHGGGLRVLGEQDRRDLVALDRAATGEDRSTVLAALGTRGWVERSGDGTPVGYCLRADWGGGPVIALDPGVGANLFDRLLTEQGPGPQRVRVPAGNAAACKHAVRLGLRELWRAPRMRLGPRRPWEPKSMYAVASFAVG
jgi:hypothetical protein